ncbi:MAG: hypothetical protein OSB12_01570 [Planctomycetota bacterium]|nr:hypothetical protein [Planctomycetota bacterium]
MTRLGSLDGDAPPWGQGIRSRSRAWHGDSKTEAWGKSRSGLTPLLAGSVPAGSISICHRLLDRGKP